MPNAIITDSYLTTTPWSRKTDFINAWKTALVNAGFPTADVDTYDITDQYLRDYSGGQNIYNGGNANSLVGFIKQIVFDAGKSRGTVEFNFFTRTSWRAEVNGYDSGSTNPGVRTVCGIWAMFGGWNTSNKRPNLTSSADTVIGGYAPHYPGNFTQGFNSYYSNPALGSNLNAQAGFLTGERDSSYRNSNSMSFSGYQPLGWTHHIGYLNGSSYAETRAYGTSGSHNPLSYGLNQDAPVQFKAINHDEIRGVFILQQQHAPIFIGYIRPAIKPSYWDENIYPYCFLPVDPWFSRHLTFSGSYHPLGTGFYIPSIIPDLSFNLTAPYFQNPGNSNKVDAIQGPVLTDYTLRGYTGKFSNDVILVAGQGVNQFDRLVVTAGTEEYLVLSNNHNNVHTYQKLAIRIV